MDFELSLEHRILKETVDRFAKEVAAPLVEPSEERGIFPRELFEEAAALGFTWVLYPEKYGGSGPDMIAAALVLEGISKVSASFGIAFVVQNSVGTEVIYRFGSEELKEKFLAPAIRGEKITAFGLTEPKGGSDAASIICKATFENGYYVINGSKMFISNAHISDFAIVAVRTQKDAPRGKGITLLVVDRRESPYQTNPLKKMGLHGVDTSEVVFDNCRVPEKNRIGEEGKGFEYLLSILTSSRVLIGAVALGVAKASYEAAVRYSNERMQFGRPLSHHQAIRHKLANMYMETELAELAVYKAAWLYNEGKLHTREAAICKLYASEVANRNASEAVQIHGGYGYMKEYPVERYYRDAKSLTIVEGTSEIQRNVISKYIIQ